MFERLQQKLEKRFAEAFAPVHSKELITHVLRFQSEDESSEIIEDLLVLLQIYEDSDSLEKFVILWFVNHKKHNEEVMDYVSCSKYQVDCACKVQVENSGLSIPQKVSPEKVKHFREFSFSSGLLQDVAYDVNKIKFDSRTEQIIAIKYKYTTSYFKQVCHEILYSPVLLIIIENTAWDKTITVLSQHGIKLSLLLMESVLNVLNFCHSWFKYKYLQSKKVMRICCMMLIQPMGTLEPVCNIK